MLQLYMIALMAMIIVHDALPGADAPPPFSGWHVVFSLIPFLAIILVVQFVCWACARQLSKPAGPRDIEHADRIVQWSRPLTVVAHALAVFGFDWVGQVRAVIGDLIVVDELIAILPPILTFMAGWWSIYPIERKMREAVILRTIEHGHPVYPIPTRRQFVLAHLRHDLLLILVPLILVAAWSESVDHGLLWLAGNHQSAGLMVSLSHWLGNAEARNAAHTVLQLLGVAIVFTIAPLILRLVWDTVRLGNGPMRDDLLAICARAGVRVREVLVWRTHGSMINGAAMGVIPAVRYILLTDALLDNLPERQVHAVMAHEVAHVRHHHIAWMIATLMAAAGMVGIASSLMLLGASHFLFGPHASSWLRIVLSAGELGMTLLGFILIFFVFGWVSRRFEWQADAFAARQLSASSGGTTITSEAAEAMAAALASVAHLNHIPFSRRSFRHGSIQIRIRRLQALPGLSVEGLPIDRLSRIIKITAASCLVAVVALAIADSRKAFLPPATTQESDR